MSPPGILVAPLSLCYLRGEALQSLYPAFRPLEATRVKCFWQGDTSLRPAQIGMCLLTLHLGSLPYPALAFLYL